MKKSRTLFSRLFWSVAISELIIFLVVGAFSYFNVKQILVNNNDQQNEALNKEIAGLLNFQDFNLSSIERNLDKRLELASWEMTELYFFETDSIESANLLRMMPELNLDSTKEFVNVINRDALVVNTSSKRNRNLDLSFFGEDFVRFIKERFEEEDFYKDKFELNPKYRILNKWSYQPTKDKEYLIQIGVKSEEGSKVAEQVRKSIVAMSQNRESLISVDIFVNQDRPFSFASDLELTEEEKDMIRSIFSDRRSRRIESEEKGKSILTEYLFSERPGSNLYESVVVRIIKDKSLEDVVLRNNFFRKVGLFALGLFILFIVLIINANLITNPIRNLSEGSKRLGEGNLEQRVPVIGSREVRDLANSFNQMAADLEVSYKQIQDQKERIEKAHKDIQASMTYARRIQAAILPPDRLVKEYVRDSFILYKPKAIVAGDFYWMDKKDNALLFAVADCTGHGVPGAMISVMCHSALNRSVREYDMSNPHDILASTRDIVIREFEKSDDEVQDGMDIGLCSIEGLSLKFAGAQRPAYIIRKGEVIELKGDRQPIGMHSTLSPFTAHEIDLKSGDTIYLFSDGLTDQFGGENGKKLLPSRLKEFLLSIQLEEIHEHKKLIDDFFEKWKGEEDQIDDVCIMGIRIT